MVLLLVMLEFTFMTLMVILIMIVMMIPTLILMMIPKVILKMGTDSGGRGNLLRDWSWCMHGPWSWSAVLGGFWRQGATDDVGLDRWGPNSS